MQAAERPRAAPHAAHSVRISSSSSARALLVVFEPLGAAGAWTAQAGQHVVPRQAFRHRPLKQRARMFSKILRRAGLAGGLERVDQDDELLAL